MHHMGTHMCTCTPPLVCWLSTCHWWEGESQPHLSLRRTQMGPGVAEEAGTPGNGVFLGERTTSPSPLAASSGCHVDKLYNPAG